MLTMIVARYKVEVEDEPQFAGESLEERKARVLASKPGISLTCVRLCPLSSLCSSGRTLRVLSFALVSTEKVRPS